VLLYEHISFCGNGMGRVLVVYKAETIWQNLFSNTDVSNLLARELDTCAASDLDVHKLVNIIHACYS
jgi:hypothetical protein